jgi:hypothetical protein
MPAKGADASQGTLMPASWTRETKARAYLMVMWDVWLDRLLYVHS